MADPTARKQEYDTLMQRMKDRDPTIALADMTRLNRLAGQVARDARASTTASKALPHARPPPAAPSGLTPMQVRCQEIQTQLDHAFGMLSRCEPWTHRAVDAEHLTLREMAQDNQALTANQQQHVNFVDNENVQVADMAREISTRRKASLVKMMTRRQSRAVKIWRYVSERRTGSPSHSFKRAKKNAVCASRMSSLMGECSILSTSR